MKKNEDLKLEITPKGSLGLLALGDVGLREWRRVRNNSLKDNDGEKEHE